VSQIIGEAYVRIRPLVGGFEGELAGEADASARAAGASAGTQFGAAFRETSQVGAAVKRDLGEAEAGASTATTKFSGLGKAVAFAGGAFFAATGLLAGIKASVEAAGALSGNLALVDRSILNAGASNEVYGKSVTELIRQQGIQRGFTENELLPSFIRLETATHNSAKAYKDLGIAEDVARARHIQVSVAALALSKAEQGSVTSLQRLGIILPASAKGLDRHAKALLANEILIRRFGGSADAFAATEGGQLAKLGAASEQIKESIGAGLAPEIASLSTGLSDYFSKSQNLAKVQADVNQVAQAGEGAFKGFKAAVQGVTVVLSPAIAALGGISNAAEIAFGAFAIAKVSKYLGALQTWSRAQVAALTEVTVATEADTVATEELTVATEAQGAAAATAAAENEAAATAIGGRAGLYGAALLTGYALGTAAIKLLRWTGALKSAGSAAESAAEKIGLVASATAKGATNAQFNAAAQSKLIEAYNAVNKAAPKFAGQANPLGGTDPRDKLIQQIAGPGYTYRDAQIFAQHNATFRGGAGAGPAATQGRPAGRSDSGGTDIDYQIKVQAALLTQGNADELKIYTQRAGYLDQRIAILKKDNDLTAVEAKTLLRLETERNSLQSNIATITQNEVSVLQDQLQRAATIASGTVGLADDAAAAAKILASDKLEAQNKKLTADQRRQYADQAASAEAAILQTQSAAYATAKSQQEQKLQLAAQAAQLTVDNVADDKKAAKNILDFYRAEASDSKLTLAARQGYAQQAAQQRLAIVQLDKDAYQSELALHEQRLQLNVQRAQLTTTTTADDKKALRNLIKLYNQEAHDAKLSVSARLDAQSKSIQSQIQLKGLTTTGTTAADIFGEAANEFKSFGSNIAGRGGILSGQDARAKLAAGVLGGQSAQSLAAYIARQHAQRDQQALTEAQKQTALLKVIAKGVGQYGTPKATADAIRRARRQSKVAAG
jgi:trimeric autotransporter adhesin